MISKSCRICTEQDSTFRQSHTHCTHVVCSGTSVCNHALSADVADKFGVASVIAGNHEFMVNVLETLGAIDAICSERLDVRSTSTERRTTSASTAS
jgi:hypothetical protein